MKRSSRAGFTLIEMLMVMLIIAIIASLIVSVASLANKKGTASKAQAEIIALDSACESYKVDNGAYPRLGGHHRAGFGQRGPADRSAHDGDPEPEQLQGGEPLSLPAALRR